MSKQVLADSMSIVVVFHIITHAHCCFFIFNWLAGNILMLSEGRPGIDNMYSVKDGMRASRRHVSCFNLSAVFLLSNAS